MKYLLRLSLTFMAIVALLGLIGLVLPRQYSVERTLTVAAAPERVAPLVNDLAHWKAWAVWYERDPSLEQELSPVTTGTGAWMQWRSRSQGNGRLEAVAAGADELRYELVFEGLPLKSQGKLRWVATAGGAQTIVTWTDQGDLGWSPLTRWFGLFLDRLVGPDLERGLGRLKAVAERA